MNENCGTFPAGATVALQHRLVDGAAARLGARVDGRTGPGSAHRFRRRRRRIRRIRREPSASGVVVVVIAGGGGSSAGAAGLGRSGRRKVRHLVTEEGRTGRVFFRW